MTKKNLNEKIAKIWIGQGLPSQAEINQTFGGLAIPKDDVWDDAGSRYSWIKITSFAIPCQEAIEAIGRAERVLEIGAGTGFWARLLANRGVDVVATDN